MTQSRAYKFFTFEVCCYFVSTRQMALVTTGFDQMAFILSFPLIKVYWITDPFFVVRIQLSSIENREFAQCLFLTLNPNWHEFRKQEKCSSLAWPRSKFYKTQWAWQGVKFTQLMSLFTSNFFWKFLIKIQLTKSNPKGTRKVDSVG